jgi:hypothetical protein
LSNHPKIRVGSVTLRVWFNRHFDRISHVKEPGFIFLLFIGR